MGDGCTGCRFTKLDSGASEMDCAVQSTGFSKLVKPMEAPCRQEQVGAFQRPFYCGYMSICARRSMGSFPVLKRATDHNLVSQQTTFTSRVRWWYGRTTILRLLAGFIAPAAACVQFDFAAEVQGNKRQRQEDGYLHKRSNRRCMHDHMHKLMHENWPYIFSTTPSS